MGKLAIGDLLYDNRYIGMIVGFDDQICLYKIQWYASGYSEADTIDECTEQRTQRYRKAYLNARQHNEFATW